VQTKNRIVLKCANENLSIDIILDAYFPNLRWKRIFRCGK